MKKLLLVDGSSFLYRAFHAMPDLRNRLGEPTGAIYGVINMLRRLREDYPSEYSLCVFDAKGKTFRDEWYPEYKANRPSMPADLAQQIEPLHQAITANGWQILAQPGVEADDVIGTLAQQAAQNNLECLIATGDKDMAQLVNPAITLINTMNNEILDIAGVINKFGVTPESIIDYLTLMGDKVDNIPGVEKVGPKTAVKWLEQYHTLDNLIENADKIKGKVGENLRNTLDWLPQGRRLVTIKCDVELPLRYDQLIAPKPDPERLRELYTRFEFKTWLRELGGPITIAHGETGDLFAAAATTAERNYQTILTSEQFKQLLDELNRAERVSFDTETTSLNVMQAKLVGMSFAVQPHQAWYLPLAHNYTDVPAQLPLEDCLRQLTPWLESPQHAKLGQHLKYDQHILANYNIRLQGIEDDTLLQSYVLESHKPHGMDNLALRHLGIQTISYTELVGKGAKQIGFDQVEIERASEYAAEDADITLQLHQQLAPQLQQDKKLRYVYREIELPTSQVLFRMERNGVLLDCDKLNQHSKELAEKLAQLESKAHQLAEQPFNLNSPKQIQEILFTKLELPVIKRTPSKQPSTDESVLQQLAEDYPLPKLLLEYRSLSKLKSTYTDKLPKMVNPATGRVHTSYSQAVAVTGRLASSDPNLQNIPVRTAEGRRVREAFIAPAGSHIVSADYSQIELRIMAHLSEDKGLLQAFADNLDIHRATAAEVFSVAPDQVSSEQRRHAKAINFGLIYGMSAFGLAKQLDIERAAAQTYIERYFNRYPGVAHYMETTRDLAKQQGYVETVFGRQLWLPEISSNNGMKRQAAERAAINAPMQGTAADLIKLAMIKVAAWLDQENMHSKLIMQVHDELVLEVPEAELASIRQQLPELMSQAAELKVPLLAELGYGRNWEEAH